MAIRSTRENLGWSQEELGRQAGWSQASIGTWEVGQSVPDLGDVLHLERILGLRPGQLTSILGFVPVDAPREGRNAPRTTPEVIAKDPDLDRRGRELVLAVYEVAVRTAP